jgi:hypothetical protein
LPWGINCSAVLSLRMICSAVCLVRFMVESPALSGRMRTLIHPGPIAGVHVILTTIYRWALRVLIPYLGEAGSTCWGNDASIRATPRHQLCLCTPSPHLDDNQSIQQHLLTHCLHP